MLRSEWGHFSAEYGFGDAWGRAVGASDEVAGGGGGGGGMSPETARALADYERRLQTTRDTNAAREAINRGNTERAAAILASNPEVELETGGVRLMGEAAASYLTRNAQQTAADAGRRLAVQPPDLSNRGVPELSMPPGAPSGQIPLDVARTSASLPPSPPPPPLASSAGQHVAARQGVDRAAQLRSQVTGQAANLTPNVQLPPDYFLERLGPPPLPPGMLPDAEQATRWGVRQVIDTRGIDSQSRDLGRQVARQGLLQLGWSAEEADRYMREEGAYRFRTNYGQGVARTDAELRQRVASGQVLSMMTAEQYGELEAWRAQYAARESVAAGDEEVRINSVPGSQEWVRQARGGRPLSADEELEARRNELLLDLGQTGLAVAGIFDPTPISDGLDGVISLGRGDYTSAGISLVSMIPYVGDLAKLGRLPRLVRTVERAVELARADRRFAEAVRPAIEGLRRALDSVPIDGLPVAAREQLQALRRNVDEFFGAQRRNVEMHEGPPYNPVGGHTIEQHVGRSESWLRRRLENDPTLRNRDFASSFRNREAANRVQGQFVARYREEIEAWRRSGEHRFEREITMNDPVGIVVERGRGGAVESSRAWVTMVRDNSPQGWHFHTSFPIMPTGRFRW